MSTLATALNATQHIQEATEAVYELPYRIKRRAKRTKLKRIKPPHKLYQA